MKVANIRPAPATTDDSADHGRRTTGIKKIKRRVEPYPVTGSITNINEASMPVAMAWGSSRSTLVAPARVGGVNDRTRATKSLVGRSSSTARGKSPPSNKVVCHKEPIHAIGTTAGTFVPVPDSALYARYSNRPRATVDLGIWQDQLSTETVEDLRHRNHSFSKLVLRGIRRGSDMLALIERHFGRTVADLDISDSAVVNTEWLKTLGSATDCPAITSLTAARCSGVNDKGIEIFARRKGPTLRALRVPGCQAVSDDGIEFVGKHCSGLRSLDLSGCPRVRDRSVFAISALAGLHDIALDGCAEVSDAALRQLFTSVTQLESLSIKGCSGVTEEGLRFMHEMPVPWGTRKHRNCASLHTLHLGHNSHISDEFMVVLAVVCSHLRVLSVTACPLIGGDQAMGKIGGLLELEEVALEALPRVSDQGFREFFCDLPRRALKKLSVAGCSKVTDVSLKCIAKSARGLRELRLDRNVSVTDRGLGYLAKGLAANLRVLQATHLGMITDDGVRLLARKCLRLTDVDLSYCLRISAASLPALRRLRVLETLGLSSCHGLFRAGDAGGGGSGGSGQTRPNASALDAAEFYKLNRLEIAEQPELTDAALRAVAERNFRTLAFLNISQCSSVTVGGVTRALKVLSSLKRLDVTGCELIGTSDVDGFALLVSPRLLLSAAHRDVDGFDGLHCSANAEHARSRREVESAVRKEALGAGTIQRAFRRYRERETEGAKVSSHHSRLNSAALAIQVNASVAAAPHPLNIAYVDC